MPDEISSNHSRGHRAGLAPADDALAVEPVVKPRSEAVPEDHLDFAPPQASSGDGARPTLEKGTVTLDFAALSRISSDELDAIRAHPLFRSLGSEARDGFFRALNAHPRPERLVVEVQ
ncbi:MAG: hypothetical protein AAF658_06865, partial [Myxococcota bacterium]